MAAAARWREVASSTRPPSLRSGAAQNGALVNPVSDRRLDDLGLSTAGGAQLDLWDCNGGAHQRWTTP